MTYKGIRYRCEFCGECYAYKCKCATCGVATVEIRTVEDWPVIPELKPITNRPAFTGQLADKVMGV
jgi:hypothetical protein